MDPDVMTKEQVAEMLRCEVLTVEDKTRSGELPAVKMGRTWVYPRAALLQRLNEMALALNKTRAKSADARRERVRAEIDRNQRQAAISSIRDARSSAR
jgi:excisionase family DNA binding protein